MRHIRWTELRPSQRRTIMFLACFQLSLTATALTDIARRPAALIRGPKWAWALASLVSFVGPITYFALGRAKEPEATAL